MERLNEVDVVIPIYNGATFVADAINSVLQQTAPPQEIIVVDDGSTDDTHAILSSFGSVIRIIKHPENRGLPAARNTGIRAGSAPLIAFLDGDDVWAPNKLQRQLQEFSRDRTPGLCYTSLWDCDANLIPIGRARSFRRRVCEEVFEELFTDSFPIPPSAVIVPRNVIVRCGYFNESMRKIEDLECWLRIAMLSTVSCVPEPLCFRRIQAQSISSTWVVGEKLKWEFEVIDRCAFAARKFNIVLPMSVDERKLLCVRRRLRKALLWNDKIGAKFYKDKLIGLGCYSVIDRVVSFFLARRTSLLILLSPITRKVKDFVRQL
ncbi:MAG: glycosyltransferase [Deltaproteobacteria bacterium]|nr:glycosyltransferase [Deltaproteobacteria bacterium]